MVVVLLGGYTVGFATPVVEAGQDTSEGEAVLAALEHVAALQWEQEGLTLLKGRAAVAYHEETPLSESTRGFLTFTVKPWPGEEDYAGEASRPLPWKGFHVEPVAGEEGYKVHVVWLSSFRRFGGGHGAVLGGEGVLVTRGTDGWVAEVRSSWIT